MELVVVMGLIVVMYCGFETWRELKLPLVMCFNTARRTTQIITVTLKRMIRNLLKQFHNPYYRLSSTYCVHVHRMHSSKQRRNTRHLY